MDTQPIGTQLQSSLLQLNGISTTLSKLAQPSFLAEDPFEAYLLSLSDPASEAMAILTGRTTVPASGISNGPAATSTLSAAAIAAAAAAAAASVATSVAAAAATAAHPAAVPASPAAQTSGSPATAAAAGPGVESTTDANAVLEHFTATLNAAATTQDNANTTANAPLAAEIAADEATAANGPSATPPPSDINLEQGGWNLATDATAKFMGGGSLAPPMGLANPAQERVEETVPAVSGVIAALALAANGYASTQGNAFAQNPELQQAPEAVPAVSAGAGHIDLLA